MKKSIVSVLRIALVFALILAMVLPVGAATDLEYLFEEELRSGEELLERRVQSGAVTRRYAEYYDYYDDDDDDDDDDYYRYYYVDVDHATRQLHYSMVAEQDIIVGDEIRILIPEGITLTIGKDSSLTIYGELIVEGTLDNRGTVIIGDRHDSDETGEIDVKSLLINKDGSIVNSGSITVARGEIHNEGTATLQNDGTITISNRHEDLIGIYNGTIFLPGSANGGKIVNNGTIYVDNHGGVGIRSSKEAVIENTGELLITGPGNATGVVIGNRAQSVTANEPVSGSDEPVSIA